MFKKIFMKKEELAEKNYLRFCKLEGSDYIASEYALKRILNIINFFSIRSILEVGLGIGSISDTVLKYSKRSQVEIKYVGTEANDFCKEMLKSNVEDYDKIDVFESIDHLDSESKFDLIIIDGEENKLEEIKNRCIKDALIFIEGDRAPQTKLIVSYFPKALHVNLISLEKNKPYAHGVCKPEHYVGGGQLIFTNPTFLMKRFWLQEKFGTYVKRSLRKIE